MLREVQCKIGQASQATALALTNLHALMQRAERIRSQRPNDKNKLYALHAPGVECIGKGKAKKPYEFGVKVSVAVTHKHGLTVGAHSFTGTPYDGHILSEQLEQATILTEDTGAQAGRGGPGLQRRGCGQPRRSDHPPGQVQEPDGSTAQMAQAPAGSGASHWAPEARQRHGPGWLQGATGDALHAVLCAAGYNIRGCCGPSCARGCWAFLRLCRPCSSCWLQRSQRSQQAAKPASADEFCRTDDVVSYELGITLIFYRLL